MLHVIAVFDDEDEEKVKKIEKILEFKNGNPEYDKINSFSEQKFLEILTKIELNTLLIVHQKQTVTSDSKPKKNDANSLGNDVFNDFVLSEYFEAFEFKNKKNEVFNNIEKQKYKNQDLRFITGSDCHQWEYYPKHDQKSNDELFEFTYLRSLPTFRGLVFGLTDESRISYMDNFYSSDDNNYINEIKLSINEEDINIPLSKCVNVIIGDNSV